MHVLTCWWSGRALHSPPMQGTSRSQIDASERRARVASQDAIVALQDCADDDAGQRGWSRSKSVMRNVIEFPEVLLPYVNLQKNALPKMFRQTRRKAAMDLDSHREWEATAREDLPDQRLSSICAEPCKIAVDISTAISLDHKGTVAHAQANTVRLGPSFLTWHIEDIQLIAQSQLDVL